MLVSYYLPGTSLAHPKIHGATFISDDLVHGSLLHSSDFFRYSSYRAMINGH